MEAAVAVVESHRAGRHSHPKRKCHRARDKLFFHLNLLCSVAERLNGSSRNWLHRTSAGTRKVIIFLGGHQRRWRSRCCEPQAKGFARLELDSQTVATQSISMSKGRREAPFTSGLA
jgi:hypothetical protein